MVSFAVYVEKSDGINNIVGVANLVMDDTIATFVLCQSKPQRGKIVFRAVKEKPFGAHAASQLKI